ncbi:hypothetical protein C0585_04265 [Candidatus Woesearchaeota archaeon]|nr:MAG: hypothetical protein C0585_04265 [Candidatus Woesearchaeota archaeon]
MTLDCDGYRIIGDYDDYGIYLEGYTGVTIQNCIISEFDTGIYMDGDNYTVTIKDNEIYDNDYGSIFGMAETNLIATITGNYITGEDDDGCGPEDPGGAIRLQGKNDSLSIITATLTNNVIEYDEGGAVRIGWSNEGATSKETYVDFFSNNIRSFDYEGDGSPIRLNAIEYIDADIRNNEVRGEGTEDACPSAIGFTPDGGDETVYNIKLTLLGNTFRNIPGLKVIALDNIDAEIRDNTFDRVLTPFRLGFCSSFEPVENLTAIVSGNDFYDIEGGSIVARSVGSTDMKAYNNYIDYTRGGGRGAIEAYSEGFTNAEIYDNTIINSGHNNAIWVEGEDIGTVNVYRNNVQSFIEEYCDYSDCTMKRAFYMYGNEDNESDINIYDNEFSMSGYGMHLESVFGAVLSNNDIQNNCEGIYLDSSEVTIEDTDFIGNNPEELGFCEGGDTTGLYVSGDSIAYLKNSNFANNGEYGLLDEGPFSVYWSLYKDVSCINNDAFFYGWLIPFGGSITTENCTITIRSDEIEFEHVLNTSNGESGAVGFDLDMENGSGIVGGKDQGIELEIHAEESKNEGIEVIFYNENPGNDTYDFKAFGKWVDVNTPTDLNLSYWILKLYYTDEELVKSGIPEETLLIEYFNETSESWEKYETPRGGVNTAENYVWANITHFSIFGLFGSEPTCSDGVLNQDEVGVDCGGVCGGYWYDDSCHTSPKTTSSGGSSGGTTCSIISDNCTEWSECSSDGTRSKSCTYEDCPTSSTEVSEECIYIENTPGDISDPSEGDDDLQKKIDDAKEQVKQLTEEESPEGEDEERSNLLTGQVVGGEGSGSLMPVWIVLFILGIAIVGSVGYFWFIKK